MMKTLPALGALALSALLVVPTVSHAQDSQTARVSYADLNLADAGGQQALGRRISFAANQMCGVGKWKAIGLADEAGSCSLDAVASAKPAYDAAIARARRGSVDILDAAALIVTAR